MAERRKKNSRVTMKRRSLHRLIGLAGLLLIVAVPARALADYREFRAVPASAALGTKVNRAAEASLKKFAKLTPDNLALSVIDLTKPESPVRADYHGDVAFYPASVVKLFFMVAAFHQDHF